MNQILDKWYLARLVFRITCGAAENTCQFDEQIRLVMAGNSREAIQKAKEMGANGEMQFYNDRQQLVAWHFINISELYWLGDFMDGAEVFSAITEVSHAHQFINLVHDKATRLADTFHYTQLNLL